MKKTIHNHTDVPVVNLAIDTVQQNKQALIFVSSKRSAQKTASDIAKDGKDKIEPLPELAQQILDAIDTPTEQCKKLALCIKHGVAFHHSGLNSKQRELIEDAFRAGTLKLIVCTPTLAAGLDMPAFRAIIKDVKRYSGSWGMQFIPVLEYMQMAGRAGRPGKEEYGEAICIASGVPEASRLVDTFIHGQVEAIYSKLAVEPVLRIYVLSLVATGMCRTQDELSRFFSQTFWAHQYGDLAQINKIIDRVIAMLVRMEFLEKRASMEFVTADELSTARSDPVIATKLGVRVSQLCIDPMSADTIVQALKKTQLPTFGILHLLATTIEMRPLLTIKVAEQERYNLMLLAKEKELLIPPPTIYDVEYESYFAAVKTAAFLADWIEEKTENDLFETFDIRPGEINAKLDQIDWLLYCAVELSQLLGTKHSSAINKLRLRMQYGACEDVLALLQLKGIGRVRARALAKIGIRTPADLKSVEYARLVAVVGKALAADLRTQVGGVIDGGQMTLN